LKFAILAILLSFILPKKSFAGEKSLYDFLWLDPDKKVYVLQNKIHKKEHKFYTDLGYMQNFTSTFQSTVGANVKAGYYLHEEWGVEVYYNYYKNTDNDNLKNVRDITSTVPFVRRLNSAYGAMAIWSPFYGKINTFNQIFYFDWSFGLGLAKINAESNRKNVQIPSLKTTYDKEDYMSLAWKTCLKFHLKEDVHLGLEWLQHHYMARGPTQNGKEPSFSLRNNQDLILSVGFSY
jgi:outer membrane beta-barrel protein